MERERECVCVREGWVAGGWGLKSCHLEQVTELMMKYAGVLLRKHLK